MKKAGENQPFLFVLKFGFEFLMKIFYANRIQIFWNHHNFDSQFSDF
jgi:hypothetical protein